MGNNNQTGKTLTRRSFISSATATMAAFGWAGAMQFPQAARAAGADPKTLVIAVTAAIEDLDPATNVNWAFGLFPVYDNLTRLKADSVDEYVPWLAEAVEASEDYKTWTFRIREGVRFHDGSVCDADAVRKSIVRTIIHPTGVGYAWAIDNPEERITTDGKLTLTINFEVARPYFGLEAAGQYGFGIVSPAAAEAHSEGPEDLGNKYLQSNPVGTGAYRLEHLDPGHEAIYVRNPDYWGGWEEGQFERIIVKTATIPSIRLQMLAAGEVDIIIPSDAEVIQALDTTDGVRKTAGPSSEVTYIAMATDGKLSDPRVRRAFCHAFDEVSYVEGVRLNTADLPAGVFPTVVSTTNPDIKKPAFDLAEADRLLTEAGFDRSQELTYVFAEESGKIEGEIFQGWLAELGITLNLIERTYSAFLDEYFSDAPAAERADFFSFSWWPSWNHPFDYAWQLFSGDATALDGNVGRYANAEATALIDALYQADVSAPETIATSERLQQILAVEDPPWIPIAQERATWGMRDDIEGLVTNPMYVLTLDFRALRRRV